MRNSMRRRIGAALIGALAAIGLARADREPEAELRVCADPNNLPFSNEAEQGFENRIAELIASELGVGVVYTWWPQRRGFIRNTLNAGQCDLVIGVPAEDELVATTRPYYRSTYVFVQPAGLEPPVASILDPRLETLSIGVHLTGDDGANPPPVHALGRLGIVDNVSGYLIYGDYREENPPARLVEAVAEGAVDVAAVWGPIGAYFASRAAPPLVAIPITGTESFTGLPFEFSIAMGVRRGDTEFRDRIQAVLDRRRDHIRAVLIEYDVPLVAEHEEVEP